LSDAFVSRYPNFAPNASARINYEIPYLVLPHPNSALVVGAGTGNDVAAALRHGVGHIDAVEIDPVIINLGKVYHPEHPYDSPLVKVYNDDARAFFKKATGQYDLIIFGFLDSHTLLSSFSSVRLDNFVYTRESFQEAGRLLRPNGAIVLSFSSGRSFVNDRMYATLQSAFGIPPQVYDNGYVDGLTFVVHKDAQKDSSAEAPLLAAHDISAQFSGGKAGHLVATDQWPFLYLARRTIPKSIMWVLALFLVGAFLVLRRTVAVPLITSRQSIHLFLLGAGFLLLETKGVTELSLLFGSTWTVNAVVIAAFLCMGLLANLLIMYRPFPQTLAYSALFALLLLSLILPYSLFSGLSAPLKVLSASIIVGLPVFFSGMIFSRSFRGVSSPAQALGVNLFGAVVGGTLENAVMIGGTMSLGILAIVLYALSAVFAGRSAAAQV
jgi:SAM-dependent methyltransferase